MFAGKGGTCSRVLGHGAGMKEGGEVNSPGSVGGRYGLLIAGVDG